LVRVGHIIWTVLKARRSLRSWSDWQGHVVKIESFRRWDEVGVVWRCLMML